MLKATEWAKEVLSTYFDNGHDFEHTPNGVEKPNHNFSLASDCWNNINEDLSTINEALDARREII